MTQDAKTQALKDIEACLDDAISYLVDLAGARPDKHSPNNCRVKIDEARFYARHLSALRDGEATEEATFQARVQPWMMACFGAEISSDKVERGDRLLEEVLELLQSGGYDPARVAALRDYVWSRPAGEPSQEVGGVMVTLAAYCLAHALDMHEAGETELARIWTKVDKIRAKQAAKPVGSALPIALRTADPVEAAAPSEEPVAWMVRSANYPLEYFSNEDNADIWANSPGVLDSIVTPLFASPAVAPVAVSVKGLIERLRIKAGMIEMGEKIAWGSDSSLMYEAAEALSSIIPPATKGGEEPLKDVLRKVRAMLEVEYHDDGRVACVAHESGGLREMVKVLDAALAQDTDATPPVDLTGTVWVSDAMVEAACKGYWPDHWPKHFSEADATSIRRHMNAALEAALSAPTVEGGQTIEAYYARQIDWSRNTFGPALRTRGVIDHIRKELTEIEADPHDLSEWVDVIILAMDGFWRHGGAVSDLMPRLLAKQQKNMARTWPDWRQMSEDTAIEHDRSDEGARP